MITKLTAVSCLVLALLPGTTQAATNLTTTKVTKQDVVKALILDSKRSDLQDSVTKAITRVHKTGYVFSGSTPAGWDCSGLVRWVYKNAGVVLPHSADKQAHKGKRVSEPKRGDIIAFAYKGSTDFYHVAIYLGQGLMLHADRSRHTTVIEPVANYTSSQIRYIRIL